MWWAGTHEEGFGEDGGGGDGAEGGEEEHGGGDEAGGGDEEEEELGHHVAVGVVPGQVVAHDGRGRDTQQLWGGRWTYS